MAYQIGNSAECVVQEDFTTSIRTEVKFSIPEEELPAAGADITVKAVDNAGNRAEKKITVRTHTHRAVLVKAVEPTCLAKGNKAYYVCACGRWYAADVLHWKKSIDMYMTMTRIPSAMTVALNGR